jgi:molybdenum cofactor cytidylyltransferase
MQDIGAVILAAGESSRFGRPKQLLQFRGRSLVRRVADAAGEAGCEPIAVVTGSEAEKIRAELRGARLKIFENQNWRAGIGGSIRLGVQGLIDIQPKLKAIVLLVCDQPLVDAGAVRQLIALREKTSKAIVASGYSATLGVPALFDRSCFQELLALDNATGAKTVILSNRERVAEFPFPKGRIDIDTLEDYEKLVPSSSSAKKFAK